ncbi:hypothetical protein AJ80_05513 [Polytolypa hystricis UAMH7299]|uniref:Methyltransferase domain-containing protein n=1 Tax=Polytolypa hystricis (strain UAMH7299) TaxID=1447883 RepID=A0A2B7Y202_POLH7|nr:hypothetical protein AJ80_05513 [Polytolypa hystricis UAMH7299]
MRDLSGSISDYPSLFAQAFTHLQPSGYIELQSLEASIHSSPSSFFPFSSSSSTQCLPTALRWLSLLASAHTKSSRPLHPEAGWKSQLQAAGFIDVVEEKYSVPLTAPWSSSSSSSPPAQDENLATSGGAGELGRYMQANMHEAVEAMTLAPFTRVLGWERDEVDVLVEAVRNDLSCEQGGLWMWVWVVYGRKPA